MIRRRVLPIALLVVLLVAAAVAAVAFFSARDDSSLAVRDPGPGVERTGEPPEGVDLAPTEQGNVVLVGGDAVTVRALRDLAREVAGDTGDDASALQALGQAVIVQRASGVDGVRAFGGDHELRVEDADDPRLRAFVQSWLGRAEGAS